MKKILVANTRNMYETPKFSGDFRGVIWSIFSSGSKMRGVLYTGFGPCVALFRVFLMAMRGVIFDC